MKTLFFVLAVCFVFLGSIFAQYDPTNWARYTVQLSESGTVKDLFDSGLRPYRFPTLERTLIEVKHARVTVIQSDGQALPEFAAEYIAITPLEGGLLSSMKMTHYKTNTEEAKELILPYLARENRNSAELEAYFSAVRADYLNYDSPQQGLQNFSVRWREPAGPRYFAAFEKAFDPKRPLIFVVGIDWSPVRTMRERRSFYKEPVPPPVGYEHVSMEAPEKFGPDSEADILISQGKAITGDRPPSSEASAPTTPVPTATPAHSSPAPGVVEIPAPVVERKLPVWLWVAGIAAFIVIVAVALKRRA